MHLDIQQGKEDMKNDPQHCLLGATAEGCKISWSQENPG
jgi:hypothetical protein